ncbi:MAG: hypothetical protein EBT86_02245 [Actinobacteria bacterium]|nr:hypothetical protein [Actinomycetota bacterium]
MSEKSKYKKKKIPQALRQQVWLNRCGEVYKAKCCTIWCTNIISVFDFQCGHNVPEVRGGKTTVSNLIPICGRCNQSMGHHFTFDEWCANFIEKGHNTKILTSSVPPVPIVENNSRSLWKKLFCCFYTNS